MGSLLRRRSNLVYDLATGQAALSAYVWIGILTFTTYSLAGHMREQVCVYMCPWPRIQAALTDEHALNVTYRFDRGEPRAHLKESKKNFPQMVFRRAIVLTVISAYMPAQPAWTFEKAHSWIVFSAACVLMPVTQS